VGVVCIDASRYRWPVIAICEVLGVAERTYYAAKKRLPCRRSESDEALKIEIRRVWESNYRVYGAKRVWLSLRRYRHQVARCTVERLMAVMGVTGVQPNRDRAPLLRTALRPGHQIWWIEGFWRNGTTSYGSPISPTSQLGRVGYMWRSFLNIPERSSAGRSPLTWEPNLFLTQSRW
jgi:hypothetical protein